MTRHVSTPMPGSQQLIDLLRAAMDTAVQQHQDAVYLLDGGRWPTAYAVGHLGLEECGKAVLCMTAFGMPPAERAEYAPVFTATFRAHKDKASMAYFIRHLFGDIPLPPADTILEEIAREAEASNDLKFRGLYSDIDDSGVVRRPADQVTEADARAMVDRLDQALTALTPVNPAIAGEDLMPDEFLVALRDSFAQVSPDDLAAFTDVGLDKFLGQIRAMIEDDAPPPPQFLPFLPPEMRAYFEAQPALPAQSTQPAADPA